MVNKLRFGPQTPNKLYIGNTEVSRAYHGLNLVYDKAAGGGVGTVPSLYMTPATGSYTIGSTVQVTIRADSLTTAVNAIQANFTYPTTRLTFQSIDTSMSPFTTAIESTGSNGLVKIGVGILGGETNGDQIVGVVTFTAAGAGAAALNFTAESGIADRATSSNICQQMIGATYTIS